MIEKRFGCTAIHKVLYKCVIHYTGRDKATVANHLYFVSVGHK